MINVNDVIKRICVSDNATEMMNLPCITCCRKIEGYLYYFGKFDGYTECLSCGDWLVEVKKKGWFALDDKTYNELFNKEER